MIASARRASIIEKALLLFPKLSMLVIRSAVAVLNDEFVRSFRQISFMIVEETSASSPASLNTLAIQQGGVMPCIPKTVFPEEPRLISETLRSDEFSSVTPMMILSDGKNLSASSRCPAPF